MNEASAGAINQHHLFHQDISQYYNYLFRYVLLLTHNRSDAEEITQTVFLRFLRLMKRKGWNVEVKSVQAYLAKTASNLCNDLWRVKGKEKAVSYDDEHVREELDHQAVESDDSVESIENRIYYQELYSTLPKSVLGGLSEYEEQLLLLRKVEQLPIKEIATIVGNDVCKVRYDLQKIEARIRYRVRKLL